MSSRLFIYCQHTLGMGHLVRSLTLASRLAEDFDVTLLNGGKLPTGIVVPSQVEQIDLPPIESDVSGKLYGADPDVDLAETFALRSERLRRLVERNAPEVLLVELFPFGRKKFSSEILSLIKLCRSRGALVVSSVRDILVRNRADQLAHDDRACSIANRWFDAILVNGDPSLVKFDASFKPGRPLRCPIRYTGYVARPFLPVGAEREQRVVVSAGGGRFGDPLRRLAIAAADEIREHFGLEMTLVAGPLVDASTLSALEQLPESQTSIRVVSSVPDLRTLLSRSRLSISQCGYNSFVDLVATGTPSVFVPFCENGEDEQLRRAALLDRLGAAVSLDPRRATVDQLVEGVARALSLGQGVLQGIDLSGADRTAQILRKMRDGKRTLAVASAR